MALMYRVAAVTCPAIVNEWHTNFVAMETWVHRAAESQVKLLLFPELSITGYSTSGLEPFDDNHEVIHKVATLAKEFDIVLAAGMAWKDNQKGRAYLAQALWVPSGERHLYYKSHLGGRETACFAAGDELPVFSLPGIRVGVQMCLEHHFPDITQTLVLRGAQLILCPHATPRISPAQRKESWHIALRARAYDNCAYILAANQQGENGQGLVYPGGSMAIDPAGRVLAENFSGQAGIIVADLDLAQVVDARTTPQGMCRRFYAPSRRKELYE